ncbi:hypothetical protein BZA77DRAFT_307766 [Pyronema omphalodes]|nr:hypothetical protein BZA77DRAFT_307766 [Pyronema omphalodes]
MENHNHILPLHHDRSQQPNPHESVAYSPPQTEANQLSDIDIGRSPFRLFLRDIMLVISLLRHLPGMFTPLRTTNPLAELYLGSRRNIEELLLHFFLGILGLLLVLITIPLMIAAPLLVFFLFLVICNCLLCLLSLPLNRGARTLTSKPLPGSPQTPEERWIFVNGVCVGNYWLQANINMLSEIFQRPVLGIHNRSYGVFADLVECIAQRCFFYTTNDIRLTYAHLKKDLMNPRIQRVVAIAHSQGGIILSVALDLLFAELACENLAKLEVYTFGCAANHFNNPRRRLAGQEKAEPIIRYMEHFCNENDFVARFGALHFKDPENGRFAGEVFEHKGYSGHLLNQHYLETMFRAEAATFWDQVVETDQSNLENTLSEKMDAVVSDLPADEGVKPLTAAAAQGKSVKELSRLWTYRNGGNPVSR